MRFSLADTAQAGFLVELLQQIKCGGIFPDERKLRRAGINHRIIHAAALIITFSGGKEKLQDQTAVGT